MKNNFLKKIITISLALAIILNISFVSNSEVIAAEDYNLETIYIDGVEYNISLTKDLDLKVETVLEGDAYSLSIDKNSGDGEFISTNNRTNTEDYSIKIKSLATDNLDMTIYDKKTMVSDKIDSMDELLDESYEGQISITLGGFAGKAILTALAAALAKAATVVVVAGVTYYAIDKISQRIIKGLYYPAIIKGNNVLISPISIKRDTAVRRIKSGLSTYTILAVHAKGIVKETGLGVTHSENHYSSGRKGVFFSHYHTLKRRGEHSFYGLPKIRR
ncbi:MULTISPECIES: hypothetical protein [Helcococcus]|uniref:Uncharacterized protein n=1 Tax=Helcococcus bovis TaxID=3153252 RepID=A0ABW9F692_9FIRM